MRLSKWSALTLTCLSCFGAYYSFDTPSVLHNAMRRHYAFTAHIDEEEFEVYFSLIYSLYALPNTVIPLLGGAMVDSVGNSMIMLIFATLVMSGNLIETIAMFQNNLTLLVVGRFIFGFGAETLNVCCSIVLSKWFKGQELAFAMGLFLSFSKLASVATDWISPIMNRHYGLLVNSSFITFLCFVCYLFTIALIIWDSEVYQLLDAADGALFERERKRAKSDSDERRRRARLGLGEGDSSYSLNSNNNSINDTSNPYINEENVPLLLSPKGRNFGSMETTLGDHQSQQQQHYREAAESEFNSGIIGGGNVVLEFPLPMILEGSRSGSETSEVSSRRSSRNSKSGPSSPNSQLLSTSTAGLPATSSNYDNNYNYDSNHSSSSSGGDNLSRSASGHCDIQDSGNSVKSVNINGLSTKSTGSGYADNIANNDSSGSSGSSKDSSRHSSSSPSSSDREVEEITSDMRGGYRSSSNTTITTAAQVVQTLSSSISDTNNTNNTTNNKDDNFVSNCRRDDSDIEEDRIVEIVGVESGTNITGEDNEESTTKGAGGTIVSSLCCSFTSVAWLLFVLTFVMYGIFIPFTNWSNVIILQYYFTMGGAVSPKHHDEMFAARLQSIPFLLAVFLTPIVGIYVDWFGRRTLQLFISSVLLLLAHVWIYNADDSIIHSSGVTGGGKDIGLTDISEFLSSPIVPLLMIGLSYSIFGSLIWPCVPVAVESAHQGTAYGFMTSFQNSGQFLVPLLVQRSINREGNYEPCEAWFTCLSLLALLVCILLWIVDEAVNEGALRYPDPEFEKCHQLPESTSSDASAASVGDVMIDLNPGGDNSVSPSAFHANDSRSWILHDNSSSSINGSNSGGGDIESAILTSAVSSPVRIPQPSSSSVTCGGGGGGAGSTGASGVKSTKTVIAVSEKFGSNRRRAFSIDSGEAAYMPKRQHRLWQPAATSSESPSTNPPLSSGSGEIGVVSRKGVHVHDDDDKSTIPHRVDLQVPHSSPIKMATSTNSSSSNNNNNNNNSGSNHSSPSSRGPGEGEEEEAVSPVHPIAFIPLPKAVQPHFLSFQNRERRALSLHFPVDETSLDLRRQAALGSSYRQEDCSPLAAAASAAASAAAEERSFLPLQKSPPHLHQQQQQQPPQTPAPSSSSSSSKASSSPKRKGSPYRMRF